MASNLSKFEKIVDRADDLPECEKHVRRMLGKFAKSAPAGLIKQLGQCVVDYRKEELRQKADRD